LLETGTRFHGIYVSKVTVIVYVRWEAVWVHAAEFIPPLVDSIAKSYVPAAVLVLDFHMLSNCVN
jgi:hypothetical protein